MQNTINSRKKWFYKIYLVSSDNLANYLINLIYPITYQQYFSISKLIHHAFIFFQLHSFNKNNRNLVSVSSLHILLELPANCIIAGECSIEFSAFKDFLSDFKKLASINQKVLFLKRDIAKSVEYINFIENLVDFNPKFKASSIRQIKSVYLKRILSRQTSEIKLKYKIETTIETDLELLHTFHDRFLKQWPPIRYFVTRPCPAEAIPLEFSLDLDLNTLTETALDIDMDLNKPAQSIM